MTSHKSGLIAVTFILIAPGVAFAQEPERERTGVLQGLVQCRAIADSAARLNCYDTATAALDEAERAGDVVVVDRGDVRAAQRQLFGFTLPTLPILTRGRPVEEIQAVTSPLTSATLQGAGKWVFTLEDGSVWRQTDTQAVRQTPRIGAETTVRRAAMGSFLLNLGFGRAIRVERVR